MSTTTPLARPTTEHYIVSPTLNGRHLITLCGFEVCNAPLPDGPTTRCTLCAERMPMLDTARTYAEQRGITPAQAARALNMPSTIALELRVWVRCLGGCGIGVRLSDEPATGSDYCSECKPTR